MKALFDNLSIRCSRMVTTTYSTSFSLAIRCLSRELRDPVHAIYGFVRLADEIVDSFHDHNREILLKKLREDTYRSIEDGISLNPILNSFQETVIKFRIDRGLIDGFLASMEMDLRKTRYNAQEFDAYVSGSAEMVGLMCLKVFTHGNPDLYDRLRCQAVSLGAAFQKVNFLRDLRSDYLGMGRVYFPGVEVKNFDGAGKKKIEQSISADFANARAGIRQLPRSSRLGVYVAYLYFAALFRKIRNTPPERILQSRIRIPNPYKATLLAYSIVKHQLNMI